MNKTLNHSITKVLDVRHLTPSTYILKVERNGLVFSTGQYVALGLPGKIEKREYSVYSGENDDYIEILIKEVDEGLVSKQLKQLRQGARIAMDGPYGFFTLSLHIIQSSKYLFIASGTGIAPFHSYIRTYPDLDYKILHGVKYLEEAYDKTDYSPDRYILCTSRDERGDFQGRVTDYLDKHPVDNQTLCYLCGNSNMIHDVYDLLIKQGVPAENVHAEVYF